MSYSISSKIKGQDLHPVPSYGHAGSCNSTLVARQLDDRWDHVGHCRPPLGQHVGHRRQSGWGSSATLAGALPPIYVGHYCQSRWGTTANLAGALPPIHGFQSNLRDQG